MSYTQHTENQGVSKEPTLFGRYKAFINSKPVGCTFTTLELNMVVGAHENRTFWKGHRNRHYTTACYTAKLRDWGCLTHVKRGIWKINGHIPSWFSTFHFEFVDSTDYHFDPRRVQCMYWQNLPVEYRINPWADVLVERLNKARNTKPAPTQYTAQDMHIQAPILSPAVTTVSIPFRVGDIIAAAEVVVSVDRKSADKDTWAVVQSCDIVVGKQELEHALRNVATSTVNGWPALMKSLKEFALSKVTKPAGRLNTEELVEYMKGAVNGAVSDAFDGIEDDVQLELNNYRNWEIEVNFDTSVSDRVDNATDAVIQELENWIEDNTDMPA